MTIMPRPEGLRISLLEESQLDSAGILKGGQLSSNAYGLDDSAIQLFLLVAGAGEEGLAKSHIPKALKADLEFSVLQLEMHRLVTWERDLRGRLAYLVLTWRGQEALAAAKPAKPHHLNMAEQRRRQIYQ